MKTLLAVILLVTACSYEHPAQLYADAGICSMNNGGCSPNADCVENGNPMCTCKLGFAGNGSTCTPVWSHVTSFPSSALAEGFLNTAVVGSKIYIAHSSSTDMASRYFKAFDTLSGMVTDEPVAPLFPSNGETDFCACGYLPVLVPIANTIYLFGNYGASYNTSSKAWTDEAPLYQDPYRRGEAIGVEAQGRVYLIGGRDPNLRSNEYFDGNGFTVEPTQLPFDVQRITGGAAVVVGNTIYVFGGGPGSGSIHKSCAKRDLSGANGWQTLADAPVNAGSSAAVYGNNILVGTQSAQICIYSLTDANWRCNMTMPTGLQNGVLVTVGSDVFVLGATAAPALEIYKLAQLP